MPVDNLSPEATTILVGFINSMADALEKDPGSKSYAALQVMMTRAIRESIDDWEEDKNRLPLSKEQLDDKVIKKAASLIADHLHRPTPIMHRGSNWSRAYCFFGRKFRAAFEEMRGILKAELQERVTLERNRNLNQHSIVPPTSMTEPPDPNALYVFLPDRKTVCLRVGQRWWIKHEDHQVVHPYEVLSHTRHTILLSMMFEAPGPVFEKATPPAEYRYSLGSITFVEQIK